MFAAIVYLRSAIIHWGRYVLMTAGDCNDKREKTLEMKSVRRLQYFRSGVKCDEETMACVPKVISSVITRRLAGLRYLHRKSV